MPLGIEGSAADISNGTYRADRLFLFERGTKTVDTGVAVHGYSVPLREDQSWWGSEIGNDLANKTSMAGVKSYLTPFGIRAVRGRIRLDRSGRNLRPIPTPPISARTCLRLSCMGIFVEAEFFPHLDVYPQAK